MFSKITESIDAVYLKNEKKKSEYNLNSEVYR